MWCLAMWVLFKFALDTVLPLPFADFLTGVCVCRWTHVCIHKAHILSLHSATTQGHFVPQLYHKTAGGMSSLNIHVGTIEQTMPT